MVCVCVYVCVCVCVVCVNVCRHPGLLDQLNSLLLAHAHTAQDATTHAQTSAEPSVETPNHDESREQAIAATQARVMGLLSTLCAVSAEAARAIVDSGTTSMCAPLLVCLPILVSYCCLPPIACIQTRAISRSACDLGAQMLRHRISLVCTVPYATLQVCCLWLKVNCW